MDFGFRAIDNLPRAHCDETEFKVFSMVFVKFSPESDLLE